MIAKQPVLFYPQMESLDLESDIGPPPRVILEDEVEVTAAQNATEYIVSGNSESDLDSGMRTHNQNEHSHVQKYPNSSPSGFDLRSLTCISGTKISPGFSSFETFKPKVAQNRKQRCDSPMHKAVEPKAVSDTQKPNEHKTVSDTQKCAPASRLPKPKIYINKIPTELKPPLIRRSAQLNLSSLTSIKKEDVTTENRVSKPKKVPPPVPPRRSSLCSISKTSLEDYADKLGSVESQTKIDKMKSFSTKSQVKIERPKSSSTEPHMKTETPKCPLKAPANRSNVPTGNSSKDANKIQRSSKGENCNKPSIRRGHTVEKSTRPHMLPSNKPVNTKIQMTKHASFESTEKNGQVVMTSSGTELEKVYKKITKFNWNSTEFNNSSSPLSSSSSLSLRDSNSIENVQVPNSTSPYSSLISSSSTCSLEYDIIQAHSTIVSSQMT